MFFYCLADMVPRYRCLICGGWDPFSLTPSSATAIFLTLLHRFFAARACSGNRFVYSSSSDLYLVSVVAGTLVAFPAIHARVEGANGRAVLMT